MTPHEWLQERETWAATCRRFQGDILELKHTLLKLREENTVLKQQHVEELAVKEKVCQQLDREILRLHDEIHVLELEINLLRMERGPSTEVSCQTNETSSWKTPLKSPSATVSKPEGQNDSNGYKTPINMTTTMLTGMVTGVVSSMVYNMFQ